MTERHELVNEVLGIRTVAADLHAKLLNATDALVVAALSKRLAELHERHCALMERINRMEKAA
jgi:hypothetical protein